MIEIDCQLKSSQTLDVSVTRHKSVQLCHFYCCNRVTSCFTEFRFNCCAEVWIGEIYFGRKYPYLRIFEELIQRRKI